jgi:hypothetical protein
LRAYRAGDGACSGNTNTATAQTAPASPDGLLAVTVGVSQIDLTWVDHSSTETAFSIERSLDQVISVEVDSVGAGVTTASDTSLICSTTYYRISAFRSGDTQYSAYSDTVDVTTQGCTSAILVLPLPPDGTLTHNNLMSFTWEAVIGANQYDIQIDDAADFASPVQAERVSATTCKAHRRPAALPPRRARTGPARRANRRWWVDNVSVIDVP